MQHFERPLKVTEKGVTARAWVNTRHKVLKLPQIWTLFWFLPSWKKNNKSCLFVTSFHASNENIEGKQLFTHTTASRSLSAWTLGTVIFYFILLGMVSVLLRRGRWGRPYFLPSTFVSILHFHLHLFFSHCRRLLHIIMAENTNTTSSRKKIVKHILKVHTSFCQLSFFYYYIRCGNHHFS